MLFAVCVLPCSCDEFDGEPLAHVFLHHSGRRLGVLTKRSRLLALETRSLSRAEQFTGVRCREAPIKAAFSPGGCRRGAVGRDAFTTVPFTPCAAVPVSSSGKGHTWGLKHFTTCYEQHY